MPSLAIHCTNINSIFGLSPNVNFLKLWDENEKLKGPISRAFNLLYY